MFHLSKRRGSARRLALLVAAFGCTFASLSGTLTAFAYSAELELSAPVELSA